MSVTTIRVRCLSCSQDCLLRSPAVRMDGLFYRFTCLVCGRENRRMMTASIRAMFTSMSIDTQQHMEAEVERFGSQLADGIAIERWLTP